MPEFFTILILVPTAAVLLIGVAYILGMLLMSLMALVDEIVVATQHRIYHTGYPTHV